MIPFRFESEMLDPLLGYLFKSGRINGDTVYAKEFSWLGRRVDFVTLSKTRRTSAYELKLTDNFRAVEQAAYNRLAFDKSYVVTATKPSDRVLTFAEEVDVGLIYLTPTYTKVYLTPLNKGVEACLRKTLIQRLRKGGKRMYV